MMRIAITELALLCGLFLSAAAQDMKLVHRVTVNGKQSDSITYARNGKLRFGGSGGGGVIDAKEAQVNWVAGGTYSITDCARGEHYTVYPDKREFSRRKLPAVATVEQLRSDLQELRKKGLNTLEPYRVVRIATKDTGERKVIHGLQARRFIRERQSIHRNTRFAGVEERSDIWVVDYPVQLGCASDEQIALLEELHELRWSPHGNIGSGKPAFRHVDYEATGDELRGDFVYHHRVHRFLGGPQGKQLPPRTFVTEVVELSLAPLDDSLFEVPEGYREVAVVGTVSETSLAIW